MKKVLILIVLITFPLLGAAQTSASNTDNQHYDTYQDDASTQVSSLKTEIALSTAAKEEVNNLSYKKSIDLISIKAYRKSLQIKVKEIKDC